MAAAVAVLVSALAGCEARDAGADPLDDNNAPGSEAAADAGARPARTWGYLELPGGNKLRYSLLLPDRPGRYPVLIEYDGYASGSAPNLGRRWRDEGYVVMGVNVPGTGCSTGDDRVFDASVGAAGAYAVEWAARQPWSSGKVGMVGDSYAGYDQLWVASQHPPHLRAIAPGKNVADPYRDVGFPGGIPNIGFPAAWLGSFPLYWLTAAQIASDVDGDTACAQTVADNIAKLQRPDLSWLTWLQTSPHYDALYAQRSAMFLTGYIDVPTLGTQAWQDEQVGPRMGYYESTIAPGRMWLISSNGGHETSYQSADIFAAQQRFYAHFLKDTDRRFEAAPHVTLLEELQAPSDPAATVALTPRATATFDRLPVPVAPMRLWFQPGGRLGGEPPADGAASTDYRYPVPSPGVNDPAHPGWSAASDPDGQATFTTPALPGDLSYYGEGSVDLWISSTDSDADLQVTLSEVRPDGMEMFVQRGWLRASKRRLDDARSTELRPWGDFTQAAVSPLVPNEPALARVELEKFAHVFRAGSSLRITIDTPSQTGYWAFGARQAASRNAIWHDRVHRSSVVLGYVAYPHASTLPGCATTYHQPCRSNAQPVPAGIGPRAPI